MVFMLRLMDPHSNYSRKNPPLILTEVFTLILSGIQKYSRLLYFWPPQCTEKYISLLCKGEAINMATAAKSASVCSSIICLADRPCPDRA